MMIDKKINGAKKKSFLRELSTSFTALLPLHFLASPIGHV
jgi:hypothetical protein